MKEMYFGPMMKKISEELDRKANRQIKKFNLTLTQARVIIFLSQNENNMATQKELEDFLQVSHPTTVTIVRSMKTKKMVETFLDDADRRMKNVKLIWGNQEIYQELLENAKQMEQQLLEGFSDKEKQQFYRFLARAYENAVS